MANLKRVLCFLIIASTALVSPANAWHCHHGFGHHRGFGYVSYYGGYGYSSFGYGYAPISYGFGYRAPFCYSNYYAPVYYAPTYYYPPAYSYVAPVIYSTTYSAFPTCSTTTPSTVSPPSSTVTLPALALAKYSTKKPTTALASSQVPYAVTAPKAQQQSTKTPVYVAAGSSLPTSVNTSIDTTPAELIAAADAILASGGYRQAAQAYAKLVAKFGNSDRLTTRRFIAQVASGDFEQAAVVVGLASANGNRIDRSLLPAGDLKTALGDSHGLISLRIEGLAATALQNTEDAASILAVANWLSLSGDDGRAEMFKIRGEQLQTHIERSLFVSRATRN